MKKLSIYANIGLIFLANLMFNIVNWKAKIYVGNLNKKTNEGTNFVGWCYEWFSRFIVYGYSGMACCGMVKLPWYVVLVWYPVVADIRFLNS